jgi:hypothetical protein
MLLQPIISNDFYASNTSHSTDQEAREPPKVTFIFCPLSNSHSIFHISRDLS